MKFIIWGDAQFHPWQEHERQNRWKRLIEIIPRVYKEAKERNADRIVFLGDLFESKRTLRTDVIASVLTCLFECANTHKIQHDLLTGNHDQWGGRSILEPLNFMPNLRVIGSNVLVEPPIAFIPYGSTPSKDLEYTLLFTHAEVKGGNLGHGILSISSTIPEQVLRKTGTRSMAFNGHYHHPQIIRVSNKHVPVICVGSPAELNWSDADSNRPRGILFAELNKGVVRYEQIPIMGPRFFNAPTAKATDTDFVRNLEEQKQRTKTKVHEKYDVIGGGNVKKAISGYVEEATKEATQKTILTRLGLALYYKEKGRSI